MASEKRSAALSGISLDADSEARIAIVGPSYPLRGGNALFVAHLYESLSVDHDAYVVSFRRLYPSLLFPGKTQMNLSRAPVKSTPSRQIIDSINPVTWIRAVRWITKPRRRPDLVLFVWWNPFFGVCYGTMARLLRRRYGIPVAFVCENVVSHENRWIDRFLTRFALSAADYFLVLSGIVARRIESLYPTRPLRQAALPIYDCYRADGYDREEVRSELGLERPTILFFGYVRKYKGLANLIRALPAVLRETDVDLLIVGEFYDDRAAYDRLIEQLGVGHRVRIVARHVPDEDVGRYFSAADVVVLPYVSATQSGITQIAYAFGVPVISTNVGGLPEVVEDGVTGYIVEPEDEGALADAIVRYFAEGESEALGENVRAEARRDRAGEQLRKAVRDFLEMERA
ncbi:MAG: glycosyltransferase [Candidatus Eisenbacteria bacterium]|nr:glycosyltransferase [Candidatus Eisenbacteria bacterium]